MAELKPQISAVQTGGKNLKGACSTQVSERTNYIPLIHIMECTRGHLYIRDIHVHVHVHVHVYTYTPNNFMIIINKRFVYACACTCIHVTCTYIHTSASILRLLMYNDMHGVCRMGRPLLSSWSN